MFINLSEIFTSEGVTLEETYSLTDESVQASGQTYEAVTKEPIRITAVHAAPGKAHICGSGVIGFDFTCDRCLTQVPYKMALSFETDAYAPDAVPEDADPDEQLFMEGCRLNVKTLIDSEIMMRWPTKVLCRPDCKGICPKCGKNLNAGSCECDSFVPDPRMAAIKDIFYANKEV